MANCSQHCVDHSGRSSKLSLNFVCIWEITVLLGHTTFSLLWSYMPTCVQCVWMHAFCISATEPGTPNKESLCQVHTCHCQRQSPHTRHSLHMCTRMLSDNQPEMTTYTRKRYHSTGQHQLCAYVCTVCLRKHYKLMQIFWPHQDNHGCSPQGAQRCELLVWP